MKVKSILVAVPQPTQPKKAPYYELKTKYGIQVEYVPFTKVEGLSAKEVKSQKVDILTHSAVILTSRSTVDHLFRVCEEMKVELPEDMRYLCGSEAIALYLQKYIVYRKRKVAFGDGSFASLMNLIVKHKKENHLLVLSEPYNPDLKETMEAMKIKFSSAILSRVINCDLKEQKVLDFDLVALFAPVAVGSLAAQFEISTLPSVVTFGDGTTSCAIDTGLDVIAMAPTQKAASMVKALDLLLEKLKTGEEIDPVEVTLINEATNYLKMQAVEKKKTRQRTAAKTKK